MMKTSKHIKRILKILSIVSILLLNSFLSFAAIISDNDGATFVTKSEFEALKENFAKQIVAYNESIDRKIDGAIAAYLDGVTLNKKETLRVIHNNWDKVTCMNYALKNELALQDVDLNFIGEATGVPAGEPTADWNFHCIWNMYYRFKYDRPSDVKQKRLLCNAGTESATYPENIFWNGVALNYWEKISANQTRVWLPTKTTGQSDGYIDMANQSGVTFYAIKIATLNPGYYADLQSEAGNIWQPGANWRAVDNMNWCDATGHGGNLRLKTASTEVELKKVNDKTTTYEHILHYKKQTLKNLSDKDWLNTLGTDDDTTLTRESLVKATGASISGFRAAIEANKANTGAFKTTDVRPSVSTITSGYSGLYGGKDETQMVSVGLISTSYDSDKIYQDENYIKFSDNNKEYTTTEYDNLLAGLALFGAEDEAKIIWKPKFKTYNNGAEEDYEVNVELIIGNFGEENSIDAGSVVLKNEGQVNDYLTTTNKTCEFNFVMPRSGIVYAKWWPADETIKDTSTWEIDLLLDECNTYARELP